MGRQVRNVFVLVAVGVLIGVFAHGAAAAPVPSWNFDCDADVNVAACERLTYAASELSAIDGELAAQNEDRATGLTAARADLTWTGIWFVGGTAFGVWAFRRLGREATRWEGL